jgi:hypothetical protein
MVSMVSGLMSSRGMGFLVEMMVVEGGDSGSAEGAMAKSTELPLHTSGTASPQAPDAQVEHDPVN